MFGAIGNQPQVTPTCARTDVMWGYFKEDCPHWWPNENEYIHLGNGDWQHACEKVPKDYQLLFRRRDRRWQLYAYPKQIEMAFCPFCGLELPDMPEVRE